jgi:C_GCAxxG_C_C family probable redox protein
MDRKEIIKQAYSHLSSGRHCAEVVAQTLLDHYAEEPRPEVVKVAGGFGGGIAGSTEELCGAFTGGVIVVSSLLGRENPGEELRAAGAAIKDFKSRFLNEFGSLHCGTLLDGFRQDGDGRLGCAKLTAQSTGILHELLEGLVPERHASIPSISQEARERVPLGACPFSCSSENPVSSAA